MKNINRRDWLKLSGLTGTAALMSGTVKVDAMPTTTIETIDSKPAPIRLSSNENPYGPSKMVRQAMIEAFDNVCRYPYGWYRELVQMLADKHGVTPENIMLTAGSTEGLKMAGITYGGEGDNIVAADPVFQSILRYAEHFGTYIHRVPVNDKMGHDLERMEGRITQSTRLAYVCNPNNPTSALEPAKELEAFCSAVSNRTMVFADEAYFDYIEDPNYPSMIELVKKEMNVIVARTFSKVYGLAGIRMGYLVARPDIIQRIGKSVMAGPNILAVAAAKAALQDKDFYKFSLEKNIACRKMVTDTLDDLDLKYVPSAGNFVFFHSGRPISELQRTFLKEGIKVGRPFPPMLDWCRVSMGTVAQVEQLCRAMKKIFV
ncbi:MAG: histidinol-phosphate transaminase [Bacteroidota bacterium]